MTTTGRPSVLRGISRGALPWWLLNQNLSSKVLLVVEKEEDVLGVADDAGALFRLPSSWNPPVPFSILSYPVNDEPARQVSLRRWLREKAVLLIASLEGLSLPCDDPRRINERCLTISPGFTTGRSEFLDRLGLGSYARSDRAEQIGEYAVRGDVIDIWPPAQKSPVRLTWNFNTLESIRLIDLYTQRSEAFLTEVDIDPVSSGDATALSGILPDGVRIFFFTSDEMKPLPFKEDDRPAVRLLSSGEGEGTEPPPVFSGHLDGLKKQLIAWREEDWDVVIFCHNQGERDRLEELLEDPMYGARGQRAPWCPPMVIGELEHGFLWPRFRKAVLSNSEIFGRYRKRIRLPKFFGGQALQSPLDLKSGDFLVHEKYGIGRYARLQTLSVGNVTSEFLMIDYKGGDKLYVPIFELQQVQKYMGAEGRRPQLSSLDTAAWERLKRKVKGDAAALAGELLKQAAERSIRPGTAFPSHSHLEDEFGRSFLYELTPDQKKTWEEVRRDMESSKATDRLVCGDVGYGKTEIAMRAAFKATLGAKQTALLCPTTILAEQHYRNFTERFVDYPVSIVLLSRFQTKAEQREILKKVAAGKADIVIGTHRLLSSDVSFSNLGLLIIDEEHRFGVRQKNKLLHLRETVDVLSLTATPIPRTLASSLQGIKDLSVIESPPAGRLPIFTHVGLFDEDVMAKAVQDEIDRNGQVFYVHNRVKTLLSRKKWLESIFPSVRVAIAHGQMKEAELEKAMHDFLHRKVAILLATTIIESGLDIPSVNTLIVEEAEEMGLSQLYQLRGRVGRSSRRAYCFLFYSSLSMTTEAKKRLEALKEFTSLGSGFRLAMRDMEIRGAGNLLGPQQHGNIAAVGLETFGRLLQEEIHRLRGEEFEDEAAGPVMELSVSGYLPDDYLPAEAERVQMYKRLLSAKRGDLNQLKDELADRCGPLPTPAKLLFDVAYLRLILKSKDVSEVHQESEAVLIYFKGRVKLNEKSFQILLSQKSDVLTLIPGSNTGVRFYLKKDEVVLDAIGRFLRLVFPNDSSSGLRPGDGRKDIDELG